MTFSEDFNFIFNISSNFSNISKYVNSSFNTLLTSYSTENFSQTVINNTAAFIIKVNIIAT